MADDKPCMIRVEVSPGVEQLLHGYLEVGPAGELIFQTVESREWTRQMRELERMLTPPPTIHHSLDGREQTEG